MDQQQSIPNFGKQAFVEKWRLSSAKLEEAMQWVMDVDDANTLEDLNDSFSVAGKHFRFF